MSQTRSYWIDTTSRDHVLVGVKGGFTQAGHGKNTKLKSLKQGDLLVFYSAKTQTENGEPLQNVTAIGAIAADESYQVEVSPMTEAMKADISGE